MRFKTTELVSSGGPSSSTIAPPLPPPRHQPHAGNTNCASRFSALKAKLLHSEADHRPSFSPHGLCSAKRHFPYLCCFFLNALFTFPVFLTRWFLFLDKQAAVKPPRCQFFQLRSIAYSCIKFSFFLSYYLLSILFVFSSVFLYELLLSLFSYQ